MLSLLWSKFLFEKTGKSGSFHFPSLKGRHNFGERVLSIFLTKIMAAIFDFNGNGRLGEKRHLYYGLRSTVKNKETCGVGGVNGIGIHPLTPVSDQDRISPYYIYAISCRQVMRI